MLCKLLCISIGALNTWPLTSLPKRSMFVKLQIKSWKKCITFWTFVSETIIHSSLEKKGFITAMLVLISIVVGYVVINLNLLSKNVGL